MVSIFGKAMGPSLWWSAVPVVAPDAVRGAGYAVPDRARDGIGKPQQEGCSKVGVSDKLQEAWLSCGARGAMSFFPAESFFAGRAVIWLH